MANIQTVTTALTAQLCRPFRAWRSANRRVARYLARGQRATAALEFALVLTPLLMLLFGFIATASVFYTMATMQSNAQYAGLMMATGQIKAFSNGAITTSNTTATTTCSSSLASTVVEYYACTGLPSYVPVTVTVTETCATPSVTVTLSASAASAAIADVFRFFTGRTLSVSTVLMKEGQCPSP
jgi:Flp pilus assembly protein TadG